MTSSIALPRSKLVEFDCWISSFTWHNLIQHDNDSNLRASQWTSWCRDVQSCLTYPGLGSHTSWPHGVLSRHLAGHVFLLRRIYWSNWGCTIYHDWNRPDTMIAMIVGLLLLDDATSSYQDQLHGTFMRFLSESDDAEVVATLWNDPSGYRYTDNRDRIDRHISISQLLTIVDSCGRFEGHKAVFQLSTGLYNVEKVEGVWESLSATQGVT